MRMSLDFLVVIIVFVFFLMPVTSRHWYYVTLTNVYNFLSTEAMGNDFGERGISVSLRIRS